MTPAPRANSQYNRGSYRTRKPTPSEIPTDGSAAITSLRPCSDQPDQLTVRVNKCLMGRISFTTKSKHRLAIDDAWTQELSESLHTELTRSRAYLSAARMLGARAKSAFELKQSLRSKGNDPDAIDWAINRLLELGLLNDTEYAAMAARSIIRAKPAGRRFIEAKLRTKGIDRQIITETLDEQLEGTNPYDEALKLAQRMSRSLTQTLEPEVRKRRLAGRLARRGFEYDVVRKVVETIESQKE